MLRRWAPGFDSQLHHFTSQGQAKAKATNNLCLILVHDMGIMIETTSSFCKDSMHLKCLIKGLGLYYMILKNLKYANIYCDSPRKKVCVIFLKFISSRNRTLVLRDYLQTQESLDPMWLTCHMLVSDAYTKSGWNAINLNVSNSTKLYSLT